MSIITSNKFNDTRSRKVCFVVHCIINSNALHNGSKTTNNYPAMIDPVVDLLKENQIGIVQMPCFEQEKCGFDRTWPNHRYMDTPEFRKYCKEIAEKIIESVKKYQEVGVQVLGIIGKAGSPVCGVDRTTHTDRKEPGQGIFFEEFRKKLGENELDLPMIDIDSENFEESMERIRMSIII